MDKKNTYKTLPYEIVQTLIGYSEKEIANLIPLAERLLHHQDLRESKKQ